MGKQVDSKTITWVIKNFSSLQSASIHSDQFVVGDCKWRLMAYPKGNEKATYLAYRANNLALHTKFSLTLVNQKSEKLSKLIESQQWFDHKSTSRGFPAMIPLTNLHTNEGFLVKGELTVVAKIEVLEVVGKIDVSKKSSPVMETIDVNGFQVLPSQVESVNRLFSKHLDIASKFRPKNPYMKTAYMNVLLSLTKTLCQSPQDLSNDDISGAGAALTYLREAGFKLDWLEKKHGEIKEKKKKEEASLKRLQEMEKQIFNEAQIYKEKVLAARAPLSLNEDNVF
ncbi:unnamed protein product [Arabidopsis thaliana]|uniref:MATH domain-containing protein n=1 Tax=Arabidopsis thaliana TaxID=3702 RepID=A0A654EX26_ARATH|nr:unnamed protein product [Arabidopsis thaliana]